MKKKYPITYITVLRFQLSDLLLKCYHLNVQEVTLMVIHLITNPAPYRA